MWGKWFLKGGEIYFFFNRKKNEVKKDIDIIYVCNYGVRNLRKLLFVGYLIFVEVLIEVISFV